MATALTRSFEELSRRLRVESRQVMSDAQALSAFVEARDTVALELLVHRHGRMVLGVCSRHLTNQQDIEDAFQATFLVLVKKAATIKPRAQVGNWLYGVARMTAIRARSLAATRRTREQSLYNESIPARTGCNCELVSVLDEELGRLPDKYRVPILLCDLDNKSHNDAAAQLGWPIGTLSGRLSRGRAMLAKRLARRGVSAGVLSLAAKDVSATVPPALVSATVASIKCLVNGQALT